MEDVKHLDWCVARCLVHGSFTRSKVFYKDGSDDCIKLMDFQNVILNSPVVDVLYSLICLM